MKKQAETVLVNKLSQSAEVVVFSTLTTYISLPLTAHGFLVANYPQKAASVSKGSAHDCLNETLRDYYTLRVYKTAKMKRCFEFKITAAE